MNVSELPLASAIHDLRLLNPISCEDMTKAMQSEPLEEPLHYTINVDPSKNPTGNGRSKRAVAEEAPADDFLVKSSTEILISFI